MCKLFSGFTQWGKVLASLINNMDKSVVATRWYFVNFAFSSCTCSGGCTWESHAVFAWEAPSRKGLSVLEARLNISGCSCCDCSFRPALFAGDLLEQLLVLSCELKNSCQRAVVHCFPNNPPLSVSWFTKNTSPSVIKTLLYKWLDFAAQSLFLQRVTTLNSLWNLATIYNIHTSGVLCCVEHFMFC